MSTMACADVRMMLQVRDGDSAAFDFLVRRYRNDLIGYLYRMVMNHAIAEELAQESFLRAYRARASYEAAAKFSTWLYSIGTRLALNWIRDHRVRRIYEPLEGTAPDARPRQLADPHPLADEELVRAGRARMISAALAELPDRQRAVVVMHKYDGMTYGEISAALDCSPQAVKSLLFRAHAALREKLAPMLGPEAE
jgi:RNA polymerase sigma-70 factor (ECF subfamily)